jgi:hypothetical protein
MLSAGTVIPASLITGLNSDLPGTVLAQVTEHVRDSATGRAVLIPQGARLIGSYDSKVAYGQRRALLVWQRILMPDGSSVALDNAPATDPAGYAGIEDRVDFHGWRLLKGIALSSLLGVGSELGLGSSESDLVRAVRESAQQSGARAGDQITARNLDLPPTLRGPARMAGAGDRAQGPGSPALERVIMADIKLARIPDRTPVRIALSISPDLDRSLRDYARFYQASYGHEVPIAELIPGHAEASCERSQFRPQRGGAGADDQLAAPPGSVCNPNSNLAAVSTLPRRHKRRRPPRRGKSRPRPVERSSIAPGRKANEEPRAAARQSAAQPPAITRARLALG